MIEALVDVRLLLEEGVKQSGSSLAHDRLRCVITLDAAVERAAFFSAYHLQLDVSARNERLENLLALLAGRLGDKWRFRQRGDLVRLHSARNKAQHEGLYPALEHMPGFVAAAQAGIESLILAATDLDVGRVTLSDAIHDLELRQSLVDAEVALTERRYADAVEFADQALRQANASWEARRRATGLRLPEVPSFAGDFQEFQDISKSVRGLMDNLQDFTDATAFATNPGELLWFRHLVRDVTKEHVPPSGQEARRAVSFVFEWILRYEQLSASLLPNRLAVHELSRRRVRATPSSHAYIESVVVEDAGASSVQVSFPLADVPDEETFDEWRRHLGLLLRSPLDSDSETYLRWHVGNDGVVSLMAYPARRSNRQPASSSLSAAGEETHRSMLDDVEAAALLLRSALDRVDDAVKEARQSAAEHLRRIQEQDVELTRRTEDRLPAWVASISWFRGHAPSSNGVPTYFVLPAVQVSYTKLAELMRKRDDVGQFYGSRKGGASGFIFIPADPAGDPVDILTAASDDVDGLVSSTSHVRGAYENSRAELQANLAAIVLPQ